MRKEHRKAMPILFFAALVLFIWGAFALQNELSTDEPQIAKPTETSSGAPFKYVRRPTTNMPSEVHDIDVTMPILIKEGEATKPVVIERDEPPAPVNGVRTITQYDEFVDNTINGVIDTISASMSRPLVSDNKGRKNITVNVNWVANHSTIQSNAQKAFTFLHTFQSPNAEKANGKIEIYQSQNNDNSDITSAFDYLLDSKLSLIVSAGKYEKKITIGAAHRDENKQLLYTILSGGGFGKSNLFIEGEHNPVVIPDIPYDSFKLIREVNLIIELQRLDTGRTFRIVLSKQSV